MSVCYSHCFPRPSWVVAPVLSCRVVVVRFHGSSLVLNFRVRVLFPPNALILKFFIEIPFRSCRRCSLLYDLSFDDTNEFVIAALIISLPQLIFLKTFPSSHASSHDVHLSTVLWRFNSSAMAQKYYHPDSVVLVDNYFQIPAYR